MWCFVPRTVILLGFFALATARKTLLDFEREQLIGADETGKNRVNSDGGNFKKRKEEYYQMAAKKAWPYIKTTIRYSNYSLEEIVEVIKDLDTWIPSKYLQQNFPYYLAGYDHDDRPIWMLEGGKFDFVGVATGGEELIEALDKYAFQAGWNVMKSIIAADRPGREVRDAVILLDMDGFDFNKMAPKAISLYLRLATNYSRMLAQILGEGVIINANYVVEGLINLLRPILGQVLEKVEVYGTNKGNWMPKLLRHFPREYLPSWYGGDETFAPIEVHG